MSFRPLAAQAELACWSAPVSLVLLIWFGGPLTSPASTVPAPRAKTSRVADNALSNRRSIGIYLHPRLSRSRHWHPACVEGDRFAETHVVERPQRTAATLRGS